MDIKLRQTTQITEKRDFGKTIVNQSLTIEVIYDTQEDSFEVENVYLIQGDIKLEISKLLHKAEGNPLNTILENINWHEIYEGSKPSFDLGTYANEFFANLSRKVS